MVKMYKNNKEYEVAEYKVARLLKAGFTLVTDTPAEEEVDDQEDQTNLGEL